MPGSEQPGFVTPGFLGTNALPALCLGRSRLVFGEKGGCLSRRLCALEPWSPRPKLESPLSSRLLLLTFSLSPLDAKQVLGTDVEVLKK